MKKLINEAVSAQRKAAMVEAVKRRRKKVRRMAVEYKGSSCQVCGYSRCIEALDFHHLDRTAKNFGISAKGYTRSWKAIKEELDKCVMVCANCHRELHAGLVEINHCSLKENYSAVAQSVRASDCQQRQPSSAMVK